MVEHVLSSSISHDILDDQRFSVSTSNAIRSPALLKNSDHFLSQVSRTDFLPGTGIFRCDIREKSGCCPMSQANLQMVLYIYIHNPLINIRAMTLPGTGLVGTDIYLSLQYQRFEGVLSVPGYLIGWDRSRDSNVLTTEKAPHYLCSTFMGKYRDQTSDNLYTNNHSFSFLRRCTWIVTYRV